MSRYSKQEVFEALLGRGPVNVVFDSRRAGVVVPGEYPEPAKVALFYSRAAEHGIPDLRANLRGISATLIFAKVKHKTFVPWTAIYVIMNEAHRGHLWPADVPNGVTIGVEGGVATGPGSS